MNMVALKKRAQTRFVVLPPSGVAASNIFRSTEIDTPRQEKLLGEMQRFRGAMYLRDGAIQASDLTADGRHKVPVDDRSWHVLSLDRRDQICACLRFVDESGAGAFDDLWIRRTAISECPKVGKKFRTAVEDGMRNAHRMGMKFGEVGGWAVGEEHRGTLEPLRIILATYGLLQLLGGSLGVATATFRHESAPILRRIGLSAMVASGEELPTYWDPRYRCEMQVLEFDSRHPNPKYRDWVAELAVDLTSADVVCRESFKDTLHGILRGFEIAPAPVPAQSW
jgi:hypothetical protein